MERDRPPGKAMRPRAALAAAVLVLFALSAVLPLWSMAHRSEARGRAGPGAGGAATAFAPGAVDSVEELVRAAVARHLYPGAVLAAGVGERTLVLTGVGHLEWDTTSAAASPEATLYDLASLSKAVATTTAVLLLAQESRIRLDDTVQRWLPEFSGRWKERVTWRHLLTHTSGLPPAGHMRGSTPAARLASLLRTPLTDPPGKYVQYSDVGYVVLWTAAQRAAGEPLPRFLQERVWRPLGMRSTRYLPGLDCAACAPTLVLHDGRPFRGKPADPMARDLGGVTGNAGLFSTAADLARFAAMVANGGELDGVTVLRPELARALLTQQAGAGRRTLGWDAFCPAEPPTVTRPCRQPVAYGHYGWTGTSLWLDPRRRLWVVLLANRSFDVKQPRSMDAIRQQAFALLAGEPVPARPPVRLARRPPAAPAPAAPPRAVEGHEAGAAAE